jgi:hypothetical protein
VLRYPEVLDYFWSLVELRPPNDSDRRVSEPPFAAMGYQDRGYTVGENSIKENRRKSGPKQQTSTVDQRKQQPLTLSSRGRVFENKSGSLGPDDDNESSFSSFSSASTLVNKRKNLKGHSKSPQLHNMSMGKVSLEALREISPSRRQRKQGSQVSVTSTESQQRRRKAKGKSPSEEEAVVLSIQLDQEDRSDQANRTVFDERSPLPLSDQPVEDVECLCASEKGLRTAGMMKERHVMSQVEAMSLDDWERIRDALPEAYKWDIEFDGKHSIFEDSYGCWTCMPLQDRETSHIPLTIANCPVVLPVDYQWPPIGGVNPPPDPRKSTPIDCRMEITTAMARDILLTFPGSVGFYMLVNGLLQIIVSDDFNTTWAASHLPHKFGGLRVCYIEGTMEPTMWPSRITTTDASPSAHPQSSRLSSFRRSPRPDPLLQLNDFVEVRAGSNSRERYSGRIGLKVCKDGEARLLMSTHVITEAILGKTFFGLGISRDPTRRLRDDWNIQVEVMAKSSKVCAYL